jgi:hypothetical protein
LVHCGGCVVLCGFVWCREGFEWSSEGSGWFLECVLYLVLLWWWCMFSSSGRLEMGSLFALLCLALPARQLASGVGESCQGLV